MKRRRGLILFASGLMVAAALALGRPKGDAPVAPAAQPPRVDVIEAAPRDIVATVFAHGTVEPRSEIDLVIEGEGRIRAVSPQFVPGGEFAAGDLLVELDPTDARLAVERAEAVLARAESESRLTDARFERMRRLADLQVTSAAQLDETESAKRTAEARVREARASLAQARRSLERTRVPAPFAGRVRSKQVDAGQFVVSGTPAGRIYATDAAEVRLPIPSAELRYLDLGILDANAAGPAVRLRGQFAGAEVEWTGRVVRSEGEIAAQSRMLYLVVRLDQPPDGTPRVPLPLGLFVEAEIQGRRFERVFEVPASALRGDGEVLVVGAADRLESRRVAVLRVEADRVLIGSGLTAGERVAVSTLTERGVAVQPVPVVAESPELGTVAP